MASLAACRSSLRNLLLQSCRAPLSAAGAGASGNGVMWRRNKTRDVAVTVGWRFVTPPDKLQPAYGGDGAPYQPPADLARPRLHVQQAADVLAQSDDITSHVLSLHFAREPELLQYVIRETVMFVQRHQFDWHSLEAQIARDTVIVRRQLQLLSGKHKHDKRLRGSVRVVRARRYELLQRLRVTDYRRFEWLLRQLNITFRPQLPDNVKPLRGRKDGIRHVVQRHVEAVRQRKLDELRAELDAAKPAFEAEKREAVRWIASEERELGLPLSVDEQRGELLEKRVAKRFVVPPRRPASDYDGMPTWDSLRK